MQQAGNGSGGPPGTAGAALEGDGPKAGSGAGSWVAGGLRQRPTPGRGQKRRFKTGPSPTKEAVLAKSEGEPRQATEEGQAKGQRGAPRRGAGGQETQARRRGLGASAPSSCVPRSARACRQRWLFSHQLLGRPWLRSQLCPPRWRVHGLAPRVSVAPTGGKTSF